mmetsp:Transcript_3150/g.4448  ORF Transcript_3150/g.4448 Transcript_3150/m.4448 type:complete len:589 (+) Transcript_3150:44-1810(+)
MDPQTIYYFLYLAIAVVGVKYHAALSFLLLDFISKSATSRSVLLAIYNPRKQLFMTTLLSLVFIYIFAMFQFFFINSPDQYAEPQTFITLMNTFKFLVRLGFPYASPENYMVLDIYDLRVINDVLFFIMSMLMINILKGITIDTFVELRKELEKRMKDTLEKCFICGIEKNTFNRTLDRDAFRVHTKLDQNLWNYIYFIIFLWEQDKDDDDGLETFVRRCVAANDLSWFPMNKALRLAQHLEKGDVTSLKYKFRKNLIGTEELVQNKMKSFKDQLGRAISRIEKSLQYEAEANNSNGYKPATAVKEQQHHPTATSAVSTNSSRRPSVKAKEEEDNNKQTPKEVGFLVPSSSNKTQKRESGFDMMSFRSFRSMRNLPLEHHQSMNAFEADIKCQLHAKVVFVSGICLDKKGLNNVYVRIISALDHTVYKSVATSDTLTHDLHQLKRNHTVRFDSAVEDSTLSWEGSLPTVDLHKVFVRAQVLYGQKDDMKYVGGLNISLAQLLAVADSGGILELEFSQRQFELNDTSVMNGASHGVHELDLVEVDAEGKSFVAANDKCTLALSAVASPQLLEDWSFRSSRPATSKMPYT